MSLMYKNNLLNRSLYKLGKVPSPMCSLCAAEEETADHILFRCNQVEESLRQSVVTNYKAANNISDSGIVEADFIQLINTSRNMHIKPKWQHHFTPAHQISRETVNKQKSYVGLKFGS